MPRFVHSELGYHAAVVFAGSFQQRPKANRTLINDIRSLSPRLISLSGFGFLDIEKACPVWGEKDRGDRPRRGIGFVDTLAQSVWLGPLMSFIVWISYCHKTTKIQMRGRSTKLFFTFPYTQQTFRTKNRNWTWNEYWLSFCPPAYHCFTTSTHSTVITTPLSCSSLACNWISTISQRKTRDCEWVHNSDSRRSFIGGLR